MLMVRSMLSLLLLLAHLWSKLYRVVVVSFPLVLVVVLRSFFNYDLIIVIDPAEMLSLPPVDDRVIRNVISCPI